MPASVQELIEYCLINSANLSGGKAKYDLQPQAMVPGPQKHPTLPPGALGVPQDRILP